MMRLSNIEIHADGDMKVTLEVTGPGHGPRSDTLTFVTTLPYLERQSLKEIEREAMVKAAKAIVDSGIKQGF